MSLSIKRENYLEAGDAVDDEAQAVEDEVSVYRHCLHHRLY